MGIFETGKKVKNSAVGFRKLNSYLKNLRRDLKTETNI